MRQGGGGVRRRGPMLDGESAMENHADALNRANARFVAALDALEAAVSRNLAAQRDSRAYDAEIQQLSEDRSRLAQNLDFAQARAARLESAASNVGERLDAAMASVGELLQRGRPS